MPPDETEELLAMRLVAQRCLYGVDRNPMAVDLAKLSLWLATLAKDHPFTFLDHNLRCGDSLVGLTQKQIEAFTWEEKTAGKQRILGQDFLENCIKAATSYRREILEGGDYVLPALKAAKLKLADEALDEVRFAGDLIISAFFGADKDKTRYPKLEELRERYVACHASKTFDPTLKPREAVQHLRSGHKAVWPFHWEIEYPEVFDREYPGFDAIVGNPPFAGVVTLAMSTSATYTDFLRTMTVETGGKCDLVAFFYRRAWKLLRLTGAFGLIATKTIAQGDTRRSGLTPIMQDGGNIYSARRRFEWPGQASVFVAVVMVTRLPVQARDLDGKPARNINAFLLDSEITDEPKPLLPNQSRAFLGCKPGAKWHVVGEREGGYFPTDEADVFCARHTDEASIFRSYVGGAELYAIPTCNPERRIVGLGLLNRAEASRYPNALAALARIAGVANPAKNVDWWLYSRRAVDLFERLPKYRVVIVRAEVSDTFAFVLLSSECVFSNKSIVFLLDRFAAFSVLQSSLHEGWSRLTSSTQGEGLPYVPAYSFDTFPFPGGFETNAALEAAGREYYEFRAALMVRNNEGLTKTYNRFHAPEETSPDILKLRELHTAMDRAVLNAYGWTDISTECEFLLDYDDEDDDEATGKGRQRKKPWRYRWPDAVRDEVLARLLKLNAERAEQERLAGLASSPAKPIKKSSGAKPGRKSKSAGITSAQPELLPPAQGDLFG